MQYQSKKIGEVLPLSFNFTEFLQPTETISSAALTVTVVRGIDPAANFILPGTSPTITLGVVSTTVSNGVADAAYQIKCMATTSTGKIYNVTIELDVFDTTTARQQFADFCIRQLGAPVINIEVSDEQVDDCIQQAINYFHEYHFDGIERDYYVYRITGTTITVANAASFAVGSTLTSTDGRTQALISSVNYQTNVITINKQMGYDKFTIGQTVRNLDPNSATTTISAIVLGDVDNGWIPAGDNIVGVKKILNITSILGSADYMFNVQYQIMLSEVQNLVSQGTSYFYGVQNYLGHLDFVMKKEKDFRFNRRMNRLYLDVAWSVDLRVGDIVVAEVYRSLDEVTFPEIYQDIWLRKYTTAMIKRIWGGNMRKYQGMQLPGGVIMNGQQVYDEAVQELQQLENEAIYSTSPLEFMIG